MKLLKFGLRFLVTLGSVFSFLLGWILLSHSLKPVVNSNVPAQGSKVPTLEPLPPLNGTGNIPSADGQFSIPSVVIPPAPLFNSPVFVTGGS